MEKTTVLVFVVFMFGKNTNTQESTVKILLNASLVVRNFYLQLICHPIKKTRSNLQAKKIYIKKMKNKN